MEQYIINLFQNMSLLTIALLGAGILLCIIEVFVPKVGLSGILGIVLGYVLSVIALTSTLENAKREYAKGKKLHTSLHQGINASLSSTVTINVMFVLAGIVCALMPSMAVQSFGLVSLVLGFVNVFCSQALMRLMINLYLPFNSEDGSKCNFTKEEGIK